MLGEYKVNRCSRQCYAEKRPLKEGEWYYSCVIVNQDDECERRDYSSDAWSGPPEGCVGHWKNRMPLSGEKKLVLAPRGVLIDLLRQMGELPEQAKTRYLLAIILLRRRFVRICDQQPAEFVDPDSTGETRWMHLEVVEDGSEISVAEYTIARSETETLSESLNDLLYCEASDTSQDEGSP